jgi:uncharacterized membrane protein SirB2
MLRKPAPAPLDRPPPEAPSTQGCHGPHRFAKDAKDAMDYSLLKAIHESAAALSFAGFFARGLGMLRGSGWIRGRPARTLPHVVDTVLIVSALWLTWLARLSPANAPWITAKIAALLVYIALGLVALRFGSTKTVRAIAWVAAMLTFGYIVSVAFAKDPRGFLGWFG